MSQKENLRGGASKEGEGLSVGYFQPNNVGEAMLTPLSAFCPEVDKWGPSSA